MNEELERDRMHDLAGYRRRMPHVKDVQEEPEKQQELTQTYSSELTALSDEIEQTPIVQSLKKGLSKLKTQVSAMKQDIGALNVKHREPACLAKGALAGWKKAEFKAAGSRNSQGHRVMSKNRVILCKAECTTCKSIFTPSYMKRHYQYQPRKGVARDRSNGLCQEYFLKYGTLLLYSY